MGQKTYKITCKFKTKKNSLDDLCEALIGKIEFDVEHGDLEEPTVEMDTLDDIMSIFFTNDMECDTQGSTHFYNSEFDASDNMGKELQTIFDVMVPYIENRSYIDIYSDGIGCRVEVDDDGKIIQTELDDYDDENVEDMYESYDGYSYEYDM